MLKNLIKEDIDLKKKLIKFDNKILKIIQILNLKFSGNKQVFICGNGGSAADAQHLSAEFLVRLRPNINRKPYPLINLMQDSSTFSACSNDFNFDQIFKRNLQALGKKGDVLICLSTSGNSKNIINVIKFAKKEGILVISFLGKDGGKCKNLSDIELIIPSRKTAKIQECHMMLGHYILEKVEDKLLNV
jgi:D-sedoheptulose 7-phosphate isomerase